MGMSVSSGVSVSGSAVSRSVVSGRPVSSSVLYLGSVVSRGSACISEWPVSRECLYPGEVCIS